MKSARPDEGLREVPALQVDPDLGEGLDPADRQAARRACRGQLWKLPSGSSPDETVLTERTDLVAIVIVTGVILRESWLADRCMVEFLGAGDVFQLPALSEPARLSTAPQMTAIGDCTLMVLAQHFLLAAARWPPLLVSLQRRLEMQRERLATQGLIAHLPRTEQRLVCMLRHIANRFGYVTPAGTVIPWPLTHEMLGQLIAARRPTVSLALTQLEHDGVVLRHPDGWLLSDKADQMVHAVFGHTTRSLGKRLNLYRRVSETRAQNRALKAEARQLRLP